MAKKLHDFQWNLAAIQLKNQALLIGEWGRMAMRPYRVDSFQEIS